MRRRRKALEKGDTPVKKNKSKKGIISFPNQERSMTCSLIIRSISIAESAK